MSRNRKKTTFSSSSIFGSPINRRSLYFVRLCTDFMVKKGLGEKGLFRLSAGTTNIAQLKKAIEKEIDFQFDPSENIHTVAGLLKLFFREMPEPLLTFDLYDAFIAAHGTPEEQRRKDIIKRVVQLLDFDRQYLLGILCEFLYKVSCFQEQNMMHSRNLAIVFAPNILRPRIDDAEVIIGDAAFAYGLVETLISESKYFFEDILKDQKTETKAESFKKQMEDKYAKLRMRSDTLNLPKQSVEPTKADEFKKQMETRYNNLRHQSRMNIRQSLGHSNLSDKEIKQQLTTLKDKILEGDVIDTPLPIFSSVVPNFSAKVATPSPPVSPRHPVANPVKNPRQPIPQPKRHSPSYPPPYSEPHANKHQKSNSDPSKESVPNGGLNQPKRGGVLRLANKSKFTKTSQDISAKGDYSKIMKELLKNKNSQ